MGEQEKTKEQKWHEKESTKWKEEVIGEEDISRNNRPVKIKV